MGLLRADRPDQRWEEAELRSLFDLEKPGEVSRILDTHAGFSIVKLAEVREPVVRPLAEVRDQIRNRLLRGKKEKVEEEFYAALRGQTDIRVNRELLDKVKSPAAAEPEGPPALPGDE